jgi:hypothetical protein
VSFPKPKSQGKKLSNPWIGSDSGRNTWFARNVQPTNAPRFNLECIALDGANHRMIATDGRQIYEAKGVDFPWEDCCYLPTGKCFPEKLLLQSGNLEVAKTKEVLAFRNGAWTYLVKLGDTSFPPVDNLVCDIGDTELLLRVSEEDANRLIELLPHLPGKERRSSVVEFKAEQQIILSGESKGTDSEASSQFALNSSHWIGGPFGVLFNREYLLRALEHGLRTFRFFSGSAPIVSETETAKYLFMPMTLQEEEAQPEEATEDSNDETPEPPKEKPASKPNPAEVRRQRIEWLNREALWLATELAKQHGFISPSESASPVAQIRRQLEEVVARLADLSDKRKRSLTLEDLLPPQDPPTWEEVGSFAREDGTLVHLVRSEEGFFSIRNGEVINISSEDVSGILEPLLSHVWKPSCLALYYNGQRWWIEAEHNLSRKGNKAQRQLVVGVPRPASQGVIEWEIGLLQKLLDEPAESLPVRARENAERRLERLKTWQRLPAPQPLDLLSLCLKFAKSA